MRLKFFYSDAVQGGIESDEIEISDQVPDDLMPMVMTWIINSTGDASPLFSRPGHDVERFEDGTVHMQLFYDEQRPMQFDVWYNRLDPRLADAAAMKWINDDEV